MVQGRIALTLLLSTAASASTFAGTCENAVACAAPCPATDTCYFSGECGQGRFCIPYPEWPVCSPGFCRCENGNWVCLNDPCAGYCAQGGDTDGDGVADFYDNCPTVANPSQSNCDRDALGDACDGCHCDAENDIDMDTVCGTHDNCRYVFNPTQADTDGDGLGDACDCGPQNPQAGTPPEISTIVATVVAASATRIHWQSVARADRYEIARVSLLDRSLSCRTGHDENATDTEFIDSDVPEVGQGWGYRVRGVDATCGGGGAWGGYWTAALACP